MRNARTPASASSIAAAPPAAATTQGCPNSSRALGRRRGLRRSSERIRSFASSETDAQMAPLKAHLRQRWPSAFVPIEDANTEGIDRWREWISSSALAD